MNVQTNLQIALFMGANKRNQTDMFVPIHGICNYITIELGNGKILEYHKSWDWLMPVVHKCLTICKAKMLNEWENQFTQSFKSLSLDEMYNTTISFINNIQE